MTPTDSHREYMALPPLSQARNDYFNAHMSDLMAHYRAKSQPPFSAFSEQSKPDILTQFAALAGSAATTFFNKNKAAIQAAYSATKKTK